MNIAERLEYEYLVAENAREIEQQACAMRVLLKNVRFARNAFQDGCPDLALEILGQILRAYGEEQP